MQGYGGWLHTKLFLTSGAHQGLLPHCYMSITHISLDLKSSPLVFERNKGFVGDCYAVKTFHHINCSATTSCGCWTWDEKQ